MSTDDVSQALQLSPKRRLVTLICIASAIMVSIVHQLGPFYTSEALARHPTGGPEYYTAVGGVYSIHSVATVAVSPLIIWDLPNIGSKQLLVLAIAADAGSQFLFAFIDRINNWRIFLAYSYCLEAIQGIAFPCTTIASLAYLTKLYPTNLGFVNGFQMTFISIGDAVGILLAGGLYDLGGFEAPFLATAPMMLAVSIAMAILMTDTDTLTAAGSSGDAKVKEKHVAVSTILRAPWIWLMILVLLMSNVAYSACAALLAPNMKKEFGSSAILFSAAFCLQIAMTVVASPITGVLLDRGWSSRLLIIVGTVLSGLGCVLVGPAGFLHLPKSLWLVFVSMVPLGIGHSLMTVPTICFMSEHCEGIGLGNAVELRVAIAGVSRITLSTGYAAGPLVLSPLISTIGFSKAFTMLGFVYFVTALLIAVLYFLHKASTSAKTRCSEGSQSEGAGDMELQPLKP